MVRNSGKRCQSVKKSIYIALLLFITLIIPVIANGQITAAEGSSMTEFPESKNPISISDVPTGYTGKGSALSATIQGTFTSNSSLWSISTSSLALDYTTGTSFTVSNSSSVTWTTYIQVSPPSGVDSVSFSVVYQNEDWNIVSVKNPLDVVKSETTDWTAAGGVLQLYSSAMDSYGLWKLEFLSENLLTDLELGLSGGSLSTTATFGITDEMEVQGTTPWITGATTEFTLTDPSGVTWASSTNTTAGSTSHLLTSFKYRKVITVSSALVGPSDVVNLPILINITDSDLKTKTQADGDDIVFVSGGNILAHEIEVFDQAFNSTHAHLLAWVRVNLSSTIDTDITMYYGNSFTQSMQDPHQVWVSDYAAVYHLGEQVVDEQTSGIHVDSTGKYNASQGGNDDTPTIFGNGQVFSTDDSITILSSQGLNPSSDVTISGWFKLDTTFDSTSPTSQVLVTKFLTGNNDMHIALVGLDYTGGGVIRRGAMVFKLENDDFVSRYYLYSARTTWSANTWYHFACVMDASTPANHKIYINGLDNTFSSSGSGTFNNITYSGDWGIGGGLVDNQFTTNPAYFNGTLDEVRIADTVLPASYLLTQYRSLSSPDTFYSVAAEISRPLTYPNWLKQLDSTADAGQWTLTAFYNDSGLSVSNRVGMFQRIFTVKHDSSLTLDAPGDALDDNIAAKIAGDLLYVSVNLTDDVDSSFISGATVTMNWTITGSPTTVTFDDYGDGRYGIALNTTDLVNYGRWHLDIQSTHPYYNPASTFFELDISHRTYLLYETPSSTPYGDDFVVVITLRDQITSALISGATITSNGTIVGSATDHGNGTYSVTLDSAALSVGNYVYQINATPSETYLLEASVSIIFMLRNIDTALFADGGNSVTTPYNQDTSMTITLSDIDHGLAGITGASASLVQWPSGISGSVVEVSGGDYTVNMVVGTSTPGVYLINITMSKTNYADAQITLALTIRAHNSFINVAYDSLIPFGNSSDFNVTWYDLDNSNAEISAIYLNQITVGGTPFSSMIFTLDTSSWAVGTFHLDVILTSSSAIYNGASMQVTITIRALDTYLYHEPSDLIFPSGDDFNIVLRVNVSESGNQYDGDPILSLTQGEFSVSGGYSFSLSELGSGRYDFTISGASFSTGQYQILITVNPSSVNYDTAFVLITFLYRPATSFLSSPSYPLVITPVETNVDITLNYTDVDRAAGITGATITPTGISISFVDEGNGLYTVTLIVTGLSKGDYQFNLTATEASSETKTLTFTLTIRIAYTYAVPTVGSLDIPVGNDPIFYVNYTDIDHATPVSNDTGAVTVVSTWTNYLVEWLSAQGRYRITFFTDESDTLQQNLLVNFTFSRADYQDGDFSITVTIRTHNTEFRLVSAVEPTSTIGVINISVYYGDLDNALGIKSSIVSFTVQNTSGLVVFSVDNDTVSGAGFYLISINANQFGQGIQTFTINVTWTGITQTYFDKSLSTTANVVGVESALTLLLSSGPTPYLDEMSFTFFYSELFSGTGIDNSTGNVLVYVDFVGETVDLGQVSIIEVDQALQPGNYSITFNTTIFGRIVTGTPIYMNVYVNWTTGVAPFYTNRADVVPVRVLPRDTLVSLTPPSPTSYGENATFTFTYEDVTGGASDVILDDVKLSIGLNASFSYIHLAGTFTISFNTSQFGALGQKALILDVTWAGSPFYANRTGRVVFINVIVRQTTVEYLAPPPTQYLDETQFTVTWTDVTGSSSTGITGATLTLYDGASPVDPTNYSVVELSGGQYQVTLNSTYKYVNGTFPLTVLLHSTSPWISDANVTQQFRVTDRATILSSPPVPTAPYNSVIEFHLYYRDLYTGGDIGNLSGLVSLEFLTAGPWIYYISWMPTQGYYNLTVVTSNQVLNIGQIYSLDVRLVYDNLTPFYQDAEVTVSFELRIRASSLDLDVEPSTTAYNDNATFTVLFSDSDSGAGITGATISIYNSSLPLTENTHFTYTDFGDGTYTIILNTSALGDLGQHSIEIHADWTSGSPYHDNSTLNVRVISRARNTNVEITAPPAQTMFLDIVIFTFEYTDLDAGTAITAITVGDISLFYFNGTLISSGFSLVQLGSQFELSINSTIVGNIYGRYNLTVAVDWIDSEKPYYSDDSTIVFITITQRSMSIAVDPINTTPFGDNLTIVFPLTDTSTSASIEGATISSDCQSPSLPYYWLEVGTGVNAGTYTIKVNTTLLGTTGTYNFDLDIQWDPYGVPYYRNLTTITLKGSTNLIHSVLLNDQPSPSSVQFTDSVFIVVYYNDLDHGVGIEGASLTVFYEGTTTQPHGLTIVENGLGVYNISFDTTDLVGLGARTLDITASLWPYEDSISNPTFTVVTINTFLNPVEPSVQVYWNSNATVSVEFNDILHGNFTTGATVRWSSGVFSGVLNEFVGTGVYQAKFNTTVFTAGSHIITIQANKTGFTDAIATVTLVVLSLQSDMNTIDPTQALLFIPRGGGINITVYLMDTSSGGPILDQYVTLVTLSLETFSTFLSYNGTPGFYTGVIPAGGPTILDIGSSYDVRIAAELVNFVPAADSFKINVLQTQSLLELASGTTEDEEAFYSEIVNFTVYLSAPDIPVDIDNATVTWVLAEKGLNGTLTGLGSSGLFIVSFNTTEVGYGIWGISFRASPNNPIYSASSTRLSLTIKRIPTDVDRPPTLDVSWGWSGNLSFVFDAGRFGYVPNALAEYSWDIFEGNATDLGNGTYLIFVNTTLVSPGSYTLTISFIKENYQEGPASVTIIVREVRTEIVMDSVQYTPEYQGIIDNPLELQLPYGDALTVYILFNDTDADDGYVGGLEGAVATENSYLRGPSIDSSVPVTMVDLGNGLYSFTFDSTDEAIAAIIHDDQYRLYIEMFLENRKRAEILIRIQIIEIPAVLILTNSEESISFANGEGPTLRFFFNDTWHNQGITGATLNISRTTQAVTPVWREIGDGIYEVELQSGGLLNTGAGVIQISVQYGNYTSQTITVLVDVQQNSLDTLTINLFYYGLPFALIVIMILVGYVRIWSVPKRLRQINSQIKTIRKGKIPKPLTGVKMRQQLIADLFNDTYSSLAITRTASQMPEETIPVNIPEMGELLVQLSILTNLSPTELDEFKADIAKMKMSEQAAFVREVIEQEAIRAARRDGKSVDQVLKEVEEEANRRIAGDEVETAVSVPTEPEVKSVILEEEVVPTLEPIEEPAPSEPIITEPSVDMDDKLSVFELGELRADLIRKGVPEHEINILIEQAKNLPRDLVDELVKSLDKDE